MARDSVGGDENYTLESGLLPLQAREGAADGRVGGWMSVRDRFADGVDVLRDLTVDTPAAAVAVALTFGLGVGGWLSRRL